MNTAKLDDLIESYYRYSPPCSCCHDGESDDSEAGARTNELYSMILEIATLLKNMK